MTALEALTYVLDDIICATPDEAGEIIERLRDRGFEIVPKQSETE